MAYQEIGNSKGTDTILLIHGSPIASESFHSLIPHLSNKYHLLIPDLPGFGNSTSEIPNYSIHSHAQFLRQWILKNNYPPLHLVGYSMGSGVAIELSNLLPEKVKSITLLSGIGVQEQELLGDYYINHSLHALQLGALFAADLLIPHFGLFHKQPFNESYARNFYDTDQRPLRQKLQAVQIPTHIIHGLKDRLVGIDTAKEHHRIIPQSELTLLEGGHMILINSPYSIANALDSFYKKYESNQFVDKLHADPERLKLASQEIPLSQQRKLEGLTLLAFSSLIAISTFGSEDLTCIGTGIIATQGIIPLWVGIFSCTIGIFVGDILLYFAGRIIGYKSLYKAPLCWLISKDSVENQKIWFQKKGPFLIFISRFIPGTRLPTYFAAGLLKLSLSQFVIYFLLAAIIWTPIIIGGAYFAGEWMFQAIENYESASILILGGFILSFFLGIKIIMPMLTHKGRRLLYAKWMRTIRWEFWPRWAFYPPVIIWIIILAIRYKSIRILALSNPAMPLGGVVNESKIEILQALEMSNRIGKFVPILESDDLETKKRKIQTLRSTLRNPLPLVLKPDKGERGTDVRIIKSEDELTDTIKTIPDSILQQYIDGVEFGLFYIRLPNETNGRIFSITDKQYTSVIGDGESTLEELILNDPRTVFMAPTFLERYKQRLLEVLPKDKKFKLVEIGTHCRGSLFLDACHLITDELTAEIDRISKTYPGFYFGRYDIKTPSIEAFQKGEFTILELNGLTSEATHIYDPNNTLLNAYKTLFKQWHYAFQIGYINSQNSSKIPSLKEILILSKNSKKNDSANQEH
jgi:membrane protein DedA with SNARE-associated domain/pimeloyl-ACP methyl ester carboxylesterase